MENAIEKTVNRKIDFFDKNMFVKNLISYFCQEILPLPFNFISFFIPKRKNLWLFGAWNGKAYADNVKYFFQYVLKDHPEITAMWVTADSDVLKMLKSENIPVLHANSMRAFLYSFIARIVVCSHDPYKDINAFGFSKRTAVMQLWHGMPLKRLEDEMILKGRNAYIVRFILFTKKVRRILFLKARNTVSFALSVNDKKIFESFFSAPSYISGYARNDIFFTKENQDVQSDNKTKKIMYMPTFRGREGSIAKNVYFSEEVFFSNDKLSNFLEENDAELFIKLHPVDMIRGREYVPTGNRIHLVEEKDVYPLLAKMDILITDYSSVFFDYLLTLRPIVFASFDQEEYIKRDRGFYYKYDDVTPGPKAKNWDEVILFLQEYVVDPKKDINKREIIRNKFHVYKDGKSSERIFEYIGKL